MFPCSLPPPPRSGNSNNQYPNRMRSRSPPQPHPLRHNHHINATNPRPGYRLNLSPRIPCQIRHHLSPASPASPSFLIDNFAKIRKIHSGARGAVWRLRIRNGGPLQHLETFNAERYGLSSQLAGTELLEPRGATKEGKNKSAITISSKRSRTWNDGRLVHCSSLLAKDRPGDIYLRLTNSTAKPPKLDEL